MERGKDKAENSTIRKLWRDFRERPFVKMLIEESARKRANNMRDHPVIERLEQTGEAYPEIDPVVRCAVCGEGIYDGDDYFLINGEAYCERCARVTFGRMA